LLPLASIEKSAEGMSDLGVVHLPVTTESSPFFCYKVSKIRIDEWYFLIVLLETAPLYDSVNKISVKPWYTLLGFPQITLQFIHLCVL